MPCYYKDYNHLLYDKSLQRKTIKWYSTDSKENYYKNYEQLSPRYKDFFFTYKHNSLGHRNAREVEDYEDNSFILALGCSHSYGVGVPAEHTWPHLLAEKQGVMLYNAGSPGLGLDYCLQQSLLWIKNIDKLPKPQFVVVQHPEVSRRATVQESEDRLCFVNISAPSRQLIYDHLNAGIRTLPYECGMMTENISLLWNALGIPVLHWTFSTDGDYAQGFTTHKIFTFPEDLLDEDIIWEFGRDCSHAGLSVYTAVAEGLNKVIHSMRKHCLLGVDVDSRLLKKLLPERRQEYLAERIKEQREKTPFIYY